MLCLVQAITHKNGRRQDLGILLITCNNLVYNYDSPSEPFALLSLVAEEDRYFFLTRISNGAISVDSIRLKSNSVDKLRKFSNPNRDSHFR